MASQDSSNVNITGGSISGLSPPLPIGSGGTNGTATPTAGAVAYGTGTAYAFTSAGTAKQALLANTGSAPTWSTLTTGSSILYGDGSGGFSNVTIGSGVSFAGGTLSATGSGGTVTSVTGTSPVVSSGGTTPAISLAASYGDTQNPYASKTANYVLAAPNGANGAPTFRAIVAADIPTLNQNTTGTAANVTGTVAVANGGTGVTTSTGTGSVVLGTSPTLTTPVITALDTQFTLQDDADPTKQAQFQLSAITTATTGIYTLPAATTTLAGLGTAQIFTATNQFSNTTTFSGNVSMTSSTFTRTATTNTWTDGSMTTGTWTVGGTAQTGAITLGRSTGVQTLNLATGATATATTKTLNIGTAGLSGSTTAINIGSAVSGATTTVGAYGTWTFNTPLANANLANSAITINGTSTSLGGSIAVGTVTSVAATVPSFLSITGSPITSLGTLAISYSGTALPVANGGTGLTAGTSGGVLYYSATGTLASSSLLTQYGVVYGGGAGAAPVSTAAGTTGQVLTATTSGAPTWASPATSGTVTSVSVVSANGFAGTVATATSTPAITLTTSITGILKGNGTAISAAVANTDYVPLSTVYTATANYTITGTDTWIINNKPTTALTLTFPAASSWTGRSITIKNLQAFAVNSASSNIVPLNSATAGTAILLGVVGNWATLVSNGTNWVIMQAG